MGFHITHRTGAMDSDPPWSALPALLAQLRQDEDDAEHPEVSVTHESEWCLSAFPSGLVVWENVEEGEARHLRGVPDDRVLALWRLLAEGRIEAIDCEPWLPGHG